MHLEAVGFSSFSMWLSEEICSGHLTLWTVRFSEHADLWIISVWLLDIWEQGYLCKQLIKCSVYQKRAISCKCMQQKWNVFMLKWKCDHWNREIVICNVTKFCHCFWLLATYCTNHFYKHRFVHMHEICFKWVFTGKMCIKWSDIRWRIDRRKAEREQNPPILVSELVMAWDCAMAFSWGEWEKIHREI